MSASGLQLDFELTGSASTADLPSVSAIWRKGNLIFVQPISENGKLRAFSHRVPSVQCGTSQAPPGEAMTAETLQEGFFSDALNRRSKKTPRHPDLRQKRPKDASGQNNPALLDAAMIKRRPESVCTSVHGATGRLTAREGDLEVRKCRNLCEAGQITEAVDVLNPLVERGCHVPNNLFYRLLKRCMAQKDLPLGKRIHALTVKSGYEGNAFVATHLIGLYASHGRLQEAMRVFAEVRTPSAYSWASIIFAFARHGEPKEAIRLYRQMRESTVQPDNHIFVAVLKACASAGDVSAGKDVHADILRSPEKPDTFVQTCLVDMYAKCGSIEVARGLFERLPHKGVVTWTAMIAGYAQHGMGQEALDIYSSMLQEGMTPPNSVTFVCLLQACASVGEGALHQGKQLHAQIEERILQDDVVLGGSLVNMYAKCGMIDDARSVFNRLRHKNVVTWNAMIAGYAQKGIGHEALTLYSSMQQEGITPPDCVTFVCLLHACATVGALILGKMLHAKIKEQGLQGDAGVGRGLVNMYAKCGNMVDSQQVFDSLSERDVVAWGALMAGYARQGDSEVVFGLFGRMRQEGVQPDGMTFLSVLTVCSHASLVDKGRRCFEAMRTAYGISPTIEHYTCMMDLLGRAGHLTEALGMGKTMPLPPNSAVWLTLLGACRKWSSVEIGREAFEFAVSMDESDASSYILMSDIYADSHMWEEAQEIQARRVKAKASKEPGQSWCTDMGGVVHSFAVGDKNHTDCEGIYARLEQLVHKM